MPNTYVSILQNGRAKAHSPTAFRCASVKNGSGVQCFIGETGKYSFLFAVTLIKRSENSSLGYMLMLMLSIIMLHWKS